MRASELIGARAHYEDGAFAGIVRDLRLDADRTGDGSFPILGVVLSDPGGRPAAAHAWGFAEDRARAPGWLKRIVGSAGEHSRFVPVDQVVAWGPERLKIRGSK
jgi:hypothetical protein